MRLMEYAALNLCEVRTIFFIIIHACLVYNASFGFPATCRLQNCKHIVQISLLLEEHAEQGLSVSSARLINRPMYTCA